MHIAMTRQVSPSMGRCELTYLEREAIDIALARAQHAAYERALASLECEIVTLPEEVDMPDAVFIEDTAMVLDEAAVITRPGAESRRVETLAVAQALEEYRDLIRIEAPGTLDGGDVLRIGRSIYVGSSGRSNRAGIEQMATALAPYGYRVSAVPVRGCLHLKSAVTQVGPDTLLINRTWINAADFPGYLLVEVDPQEPDGANGLLVGDALIYSVAHPRTRDRLLARGIQVVGVDVSEMEKAEGAVTCCSLIFDA